MAFPSGTHQPACQVDYMTTGVYHTLMSGRLHGYRSLPYPHVRSILPIKCRVFQPDIVVQFSNVKNTLLTQTVFYILMLSKNIELLATGVSATGVTRQMDCNRQLTCSNVIKWLCHFGPHFIANCIETLTYRSGTNHPAELC